MLSNCVSGAKKLNNKAHTDSIIVIMKYHEVAVGARTLGCLRYCK